LVAYLVAYLVSLHQLDPVRFPKLRGKRQIPPGHPPDPLANHRDRRDLARGDGEGWVVGRGHGLNTADEGDSVTEVFGIAGLDEIVE
jgi:hypothetical protein